MKKGKKSSGPWVTDEIEMWRKSPVRNHMKYLPLTVKAALALELETRSELDDENRVADLIQIPGVVVPPDSHPKAPIAPPQSKTEMEAVPEAPPSDAEVLFNEMKAELASLGTKAKVVQYMEAQAKVIAGLPENLQANLQVLADGYKATMR